MAWLRRGDSANSIALAVLPGASTFDIMTYCNQPQWLSTYTYEAVRRQMLIENPGFVEQIRLNGPLLTGQLVHVVADLNFTKRTGTIRYVAPVTRATPSPTPNSRAELVVRDAAGTLLFRQSVAILET